MKILIRNLDRETTEQELQTIFEVHGKVQSCSIVKEKSNGLSKGFGFVEMESDEEAQNAIDALNGQEFMGRKLVVNESRPRTPRN